MALSRPYSIFEFSLILLFFDSVLGYYCDNDKCGEEEYCCGENMCCKSYKVWDLWYFWCGFLFFILMLSMCICMWKYRFLSGGAIILRSVNYSPLQQMDMETHGAYGPNRFYQPGMNKPALYAAAPIGSPPPYNQLSAAQVKMAAPPPPYSQVIGMRPTD